MADSVSTIRQSRFKFVVGSVVASILIAGCSTAKTSDNDRSDRQLVDQSKRATPPKTIQIPRWRPGGPGDTDGKPGEPNCPDCDGGGPVYHGSVRPSR